MRLSLVFSLIAALIALSTALPLNVIYGRGSASSVPPGLASAVLPGSGSVSVAPPAVAHPVVPATGPLSGTLSGSSSGPFSGTLSAISAP
jgi:hypothetical protein